VRSIFFALSTATALATPALAADQSLVYQPGKGDPIAFRGGFGTEDYRHAVSDSDSVRVQAGIGAAFIEANELVYNGDKTLSQLIWQSRAPVLRGNLSADLGGGFSVGLEGSVAGYGVSYMEDYDWTGPSDNFGSWTDRSQHPSTNLDHFWTGAASIGYDLSRSDQALVRLQSGFKFTDVQWTAHGGSYVYSSPGGFRDLIGDMPPGRGITYRQQLPEVFAGVEGEQHYGNIRIGGLLRGGLTVNALGTDNHWLRDLKFVDQLYVSPTLTAGADVGYAIGPMAEVVLGARYSQIFRQRGDSQMFIGSTSTLVSATGGGAGGDFRSVELTASLRGNF